MSDSGTPRRVLRIITRLNIGGPAIQAARLTSDLRPLGYETTLVYGRVSQGEGDMSDLLSPGYDTRHLPALRRPIAPLDDGAALASLLRILREVQPHVVHTHMAKAGLLGRLATLIHNRTRSLSQRAKIVHTYHGHVLEGYFSGASTKALIGIERWLGRRTDALIAVSPRIRTDLVERFRIAAAERFRTVALGLDLAPYAAVELPDRVAARRALEIPSTALVVSTVGRLTAIKNHDLFIDAAKRVADRVDQAIFLVAGDGELRSEIERRGEQAGLGGRIRFLGWRRDLATIYGATDVFVLTSRNEGTPVALIESMAAGVAGVATTVGGVPDVVTDPTLGVLVPADNVEQLADAVEQLLRSPDRRRAMGLNARASVLARYGADRLVADIGRLYDSLVGRTANEPI